MCWVLETEKLIALFLSMWGCTILGVTQDLGNRVVSEDQEISEGGEEK